MPSQPVPASEPGSDPAKRVLPANPRAAAIVALAFTALLYLVELVDVVLPADLDQSGGIVARELSDLDGVLWAPLLHAGWGHLFSNTVPVLVFAFLAMSAGIGRWVLVTAIIWVLSGVGVWLIAPGGTVTVGASGVAFGWLAFLLVRGIFNRAVGQILVAVVLLGIWSGMLWGLLPGDPNVSWQGHLFGALSGVFAAWLMARRDRSQARKATGPGSLAG
ncbi:Membrane associated serine protease, rhomboid family [Amycolatopsis lurida]|uniref:Membrane protein n=1 Tax=Amycolatopsis lurida NRRL 2430 TaxID=1460371 RepID=A0A2P2FWV8_AMYLU|nr:rhomboid family intramembrane serine protease [Amycolatopsis lurida]KFU81218.1 membrane protein [Amycolatopsis lurida NRRL 2430]SEE17565.1 Membrane associated serine protease, rhomboid family [Amycolatopsis lurida]